MACLLQINVIPQESVVCGGQDAMTYKACTSTSFLSLPVWGSNLPSSNQEPFSLPSFGSQHMNTHYEQVKQHHEMLQRQLQENIQQFLRQQEESQKSDMPSVSMPQVSHTSLITTDVIQGVTANVSSSQRRETSIHWHPAWPDMRIEESASRSYLFSSLRYLVSLMSVIHLTFEIISFAVLFNRQLNLYSSIWKLLELKRWILSLKGLMLFCSGEFNFV